MKYRPTHWRRAAAILSASLLVSTQLYAPAAAQPSAPHQSLLREVFKELIEINTTDSERGDNTRAAVVARGLAEITRLGTAMGGEPDTFAGLTGLGDMLVTCMSPHSRNRRVGEELGKGRPIDIEALWKIERIGYAALSPDGSQVVCSVASHSMAENTTTTSRWPSPM